jgi:hypothetical protein
LPEAVSEPSLRILTRIEAVDGHIRKRYQRSLGDIFLPYQLNNRASV